MATKNRVTKAECAIVIAGIGARETHAVIAAKLPGRTPSAVSGIVVRLVAEGVLPAPTRQVPVFVRTPEMDALFIRAVTSGISVPALCEIFRRSEQTVQHWKKRLKLAACYPPPPSLTTPRPCLGWCGGTHDSAGPGDRVCASCRGMDAWRSSGDLSLSGARFNDR